MCRGAGGGGTAGGVLLAWAQACCTGQEALTKDRRAEDHLPSISPILDTKTNNQNQPLERARAPGREGVANVPRKWQPLVPCQPGTRERTRGSLWPWAGFQSRGPPKPSTLPSPDYARTAQAPEGPQVPSTGSSQTPPSPCPTPNPPDEGGPRPSKSFLREHETAALNQRSPARLSILPIIKSLIYTLCFRGPSRDSSVWNSRGMKTNAGWAPERCPPPRPG